MPFWVETIEWLGRQAYRPLWSDMIARRDELIEGRASPCIWLLEHEPVITLGKHADNNNILIPEKEREVLGVDCLKVERGGDVTYHGPGQLMVYPIVKVKGVKDYLNAMSSMLLAFLGQMGVADAEWKQNPAGVWIGDRKIIACGVHLRKKVTMHGFAININKMDAWNWLNPCGMKNTIPVSLEEVIGQALNVEAVAVLLKKFLENIFREQNKNANEFCD